MTSPGRTGGPVAVAGPGLVWFRRDLRLADNPCWAAATSRHDSVTALYVLDPVALAAAGQARRLQHLAELHALDEALAQHGGRLLVRHGDPRRVVPREAHRLGAGLVHWNADVSPYAARRDAAVRAALEVGVETAWGHLVLPPGSVRTKAGTVPRVFGAFWRRWRATPWDQWPEPGDALVASDPGDGLPDLTGTPSRAPGEQAAHDLLQQFAEDGVAGYRADRDELARDATSDLSVPLHFGTISARTVVDAVGEGDDDRQAFVRQLAWRDWFAHLLHEEPRLVAHALRPDRDAIAWRDVPGDLEAWRQGRTGVPVVDAGMRELAGTGRMHNRVRMVAASYLVKHLLIDWRDGERHFRRHLLDGDVAQNVGNWQWVAGTGPDAAPYFRVFNPVAQSRRHDPAGEYLRRWLPELAGLDPDVIHAPWEAGPLELAAAGVVLGQTYPEPIVDHAAGRRRAIAAYEDARHG